MALLSVIESLFFGHWFDNREMLYLPPWPVL